VEVVQVVQVVVEVLECAQQGLEVEVLEDDTMAMNSPGPS
jgi:hypothetical protein